MFKNKFFNIGKTWLLSGFVIAAIMVFTLAPVTRYGHQGMVLKRTGTLNGTGAGDNAVGTGTVHRLMDDYGTMSVWYDVDVGTSTPHYQIIAYYSPDGQSFGTDSTQVLTPSADETVENLKVADVPLAAYMPYVRIDILGAALNATNTTYTIWECRQ